MMHERIYVRFAYNGNIRTWDRCPFPGGVEYVRADLLAAAQAEVREHLLAVTEGEPIKGVRSARDMDGTEDKRSSWSKVTNEDVRRWHSHLTEALALINAQEHAQEPAAEKPAERDAAEAQVLEGWVPVSERLPECPMDVLVLFDGCYRPGVEVIDYAGDEIWVGTDGPDDYPSHWMPLPQPPAPGVHTQSRRRYRV